MSVLVLDPFGVARDETLPTLRGALDPAEAEGALGLVPRLVAQGGAVRLRSIRVTRYKPGQRCLVEYDIALPRSPGGEEELTLIGKVRARHGGGSSDRLQRAFWDAGFHSGSSDGISVPEPMGTLPAFRMSLQRKVAGQPASQLLESGGASLGSRIAETAHKVHGAGVPIGKRHAMADELAILRERLHEVGREHPRLSARIAALLAGCERLGTALRPPVPSGIHRDFYAEQVLLDGDRLWLLDLDLYCEGDSALDAGNFLGHVMEQALRTRGTPDAFVLFQRGFEDRFVSLAGEEARTAARVYTVLTLARHVYLTTRFPERWAHTEAVLALCEDLLPGATQ